MENRVARTGRVAKRSRGQQAGGQLIQVTVKGGDVEDAFAAQIFQRDILGREEGGRYLLPMSMGGGQVEDGDARVVARGKCLDCEQVRRDLVEMPANGRVMQGGVAESVPDREAFRRQFRRRQSG